MDLWLGRYDHERTIWGTSPSALLRNTSHLLTPDLVPLQPTNVDINYLVRHRVYSRWTFLRTGRDTEEGFYTVGLTVVCTDHSKPSSHSTEETIQKSSEGLLWVVNKSKKSKSCTKVVTGNCLSYWYSDFFTSPTFTWVENRGHLWRSEARVALSAPKETRDAASRDNALDGAGQWHLPCGRHSTSSGTVLFRWTYPEV